ncbi:MAG: GDSL-type esterase/lipase family protein [Blautia sp.]|nr:GDSL-type esterase/lipase family protein [Blautia sp.]MCM1201437.1 GDSL-type esterase/lipase family protein [Bacteroides fragilis]
MMKKLLNYLLIGVFIMTALLAAVAGLKAYSGYMENKAEEEALFQQRKEEILARNAEAQNRVQEMEVEIIQLQGDAEALQAFIDETVNAANEVQRRKETGDVWEGDALSADSVSGDGVSTEDGSLSDPGGPVSGNGIWDDADAVSGNGIWGYPDSVSGNGIRGDGELISGNGIWGRPDSVSGNGVRGDSESVSGNGIWGRPDSVSGNGVRGDGGSVSGNGIWGYPDSISGNTVSGNDDFGFLMGGVSENDEDVNYYDGNMTSDSVFDEWRPIYEQPDMTLEERKELRTSYQETLEVNQADREWIAENQYDFSQTKIACLGDSITKAANLEDEENYEQYAYPARLQELLGAQEVYNLGIGGSSIGRYWADAFVDRYTEIPEDSDIIIVMGGTNDGFCVSDEEFGSLEEREYHTFCGDLDELMRGLREDYPDAQIFFATPLPNVLQDYLMSERDYLLPQKKFVEVIQTLAGEYDFELIDLYNSNVLDSHDANIITEYMPDGVHGNQEGYQILAERFAGEIVKYYNGDDSETAKENAGEENSAENSGMGAGADTGINAGANHGAITGVTGNGGAAAVIGGNAGINVGNGGSTGMPTDSGGSEAGDGNDGDGTDDGSGVGGAAENGNGADGSGAVGSVGAGESVGSSEAAGSVGNGESVGSSWTGGSSGGGSAENGENVGSNGDAGSAGSGENVGSNGDAGSAGSGESAGGSGTTGSAGSGESAGGSGTAGSVGTGESGNGNGDAGDGRNDRRAGGNAGGNTDFDRNSERKQYRYEY